MSQFKAIIESVRQKFLEEYESNKDSYHEYDVRNIRDNEWSVKRFVLVHKTEDTALKALVKAMKWRKSFGVNDFNDQYFPLEIYKINEFFVHGKDREGRPILWFKVKSHNKSAEFGQLMREFAVYQIEKLDRQTSPQGWVLIGDTVRCGIFNFDIEFCDFFVQVLQSYYPRTLKYLAGVDLPFVLNTASQIVLKFMDDELKNQTLIITKAVLMTKYVEPDVVPKHMGGNNTNIDCSIPDGVVKAEQMPRLGFTAQQINNIYATFKPQLQ